MRTATSGELTKLALTNQQVLARVSVADSSGTLVDLTDLDSTDWLMSIRIDVNIENFAATATVELWRETSSASLAPLMSGSSLNNPDPAIAAGRRVYIETASLAPTDTPTGADFQAIFDGTIDDVEWGGDESRVRISARDLAGELHDTWIEDVTTYGNTITPVAMQTVIQAMLDDTLGAGDTVLEVEGDPNFVLVEFQQREASLQSAIQAVVDLNGWDVRPLWNDADRAFRLTLHEPERTKTTPDHTFTTDDYYRITQLGTSAHGVRNKVEVQYDDTNSVVAEDVSSQSDYGVRYIKLDESRNDQINTSAAATVLANAAVADLAEPRVTQTAEMAYFWPVELGDLYRYPSNSVHYDTNQDLAVVSYSHVLPAKGSPKTVMQCRGAPSGGANRWFRKKKQGEEEDQIEDVTDDTPDLASADLLFLYTKPDASQGYTEASDADNSLGGWISITPLLAGKNGLFRDITDAERISGITLYKSVALVNKNSSVVPQTVDCGRVYLSEQGENGITWSLAQDPTDLVVDADRVQRQGWISANETSEPFNLSDAGIEWVEPTAWDHEDAIEYEDIDPGEGFIFHVRLVVDAGATGQLTDETFVFRQLIPQEP